MKLPKLIAPSDLKSEFFGTHLVERLRWAVEGVHVASTPNRPTVTSID